MSKYEEAVKAGMTDEDIISLFQPKMTTALTQMGENDTKAFLGTQMGLPEHLVSFLMGAKETPSAPPEDLSPEAKAAPVMPTTEAPEPSLLDQATSAVKDISKTISSITDPVSENFTQFSQGGAATTRGVYQAGLDFLTSVGVDVNKASSSNKERISQINTLIESEAEKTGTNKLLIAPATIGRLTPFIATLPYAYQSKIAGGLVEGAIAYSQSRGEGEEIPSSLITAAFSGGLTMGAMKVFDSFSNAPKLATRALNYLKDEHGLSDEVVEGITSAYRKYTNVGLDDEARVKAIIESLGSRGAEYKAAAELLNPEASKAINMSTISRKEELSKIVEEGNIENAINAVKKQADFASLSFKQFREIIAKNFTDVVNPTELLGFEALARELEPIVAKADTPLASNIADQIAQGKASGYSLDALLTLRQDLGELASSKTSRKLEGQLFEVQGSVDSIIESMMPEPGKRLWGLLKEDYALMADIKGLSKPESKNSMGQILSKAGDGKYSYFKVLDQLSKTSSSAKDMAQLMEAIGSKNQADFERGLVKELTTSSKDAMVYSEVFDKVKNIEMITPEGQKLTALINDMSKVFKSEDYINKLNQLVPQNSDSVGLTADVTAKFKYLAAGRFFQAMTRYLDPTKSGIKARRLQDIADVMANPSMAKSKLGMETSEVEDIVRLSKEKAINDTFDELQQIADKIGRD